MAYAYDNFKLIDVRIDLENAGYKKQASDEDTQSILVDPIYALRMIEYHFEGFSGNHDAVYYSLLSSDGIAVEFLFPTGTRILYVPILDRYQERFGSTPSFLIEIDHSIPHCDDGEECVSVGHAPGINCWCVTHCRCRLGASGGYTSSTEQGCTDPCPNEEPERFRFDDLLLVDFSIGQSLPPLWTPID